MARQPVTDKRQLNLPLNLGFVPGWTGYKYLLCDDGKWHLTLEIRADMVADTQCSADAHVVAQRQCSDAPMCTECAELQAYRSSKGR